MFIVDFFKIMLGIVAVLLMLLGGGCTLWGFLGLLTANGGSKFLEPLFMMGILPLLGGIGLFKLIRYASSDAYPKPLYPQDYKRPKRNDPNPFNNPDYVHPDNPDNKPENQHLHINEPLELTFEQRISEQKELTLEQVSEVIQKTTTPEYSVWGGFFGVILMIVGWLGVPISVLLLLAMFIDSGMRGGNAYPNYFIPFGVFIGSVFAITTGKHLCSPRKKD